MCQETTWWNQTLQRMVRKAVMSSLRAIQSERKLKPNMCTDCKYVPRVIQNLVPTLQIVPNQHSTYKPSKSFGQLATLKYWNRLEELNKTTSNIQHYYYFPPPKSSHNLHQKLRNKYWVLFKQSSLLQNRPFMWKTYTINLNLKNKNIIKY